MKTMGDVTLHGLDDDIVRYIQDHAQARFLFDHCVAEDTTTSGFYRPLANLMAQELNAR